MASSIPPCYVFKGGGDFAVIDESKEKIVGVSVVILGIAFVVSVVFPFSNLSQFINKLFSRHSAILAQVLRY